ncbi:hypothetical protein BX600DRAFT_446396 [Xylariales sp. PMI_506]|nr:hypothetical protein BX600DRAFT_446396 [Xylariales sp. PMI_506]
MSASVAKFCGSIKAKAPLRTKKPRRIHPLSIGYMRQACCCWCCYHAFTHTFCQAREPRRSFPRLARVLLGCYVKLF